MSAAHAALSWLKTGDIGTLRQIIVLGFLLGTAASSVAAPWQVEEIDPEDPTLLAYQGDPQSGALLAIDCYLTLPMPVIRIIQNVAWDDTASYAPEVSPKFTIDGVTYNSPNFRFYEFLGRESVSFTMFGNSAAFRELYEAIVAAKGPITVQYFDKFSTFDPDGVDAAVAQVEEYCPL